MYLYIHIEALLRLYYLELVVKPVVKLVVKLVVNLVVKLVVKLVSPGAA
jgi:hypothetical protein